jgi:hypothetical protein
MPNKQKSDLDSIVNDLKLVLNKYDIKYKIDKSTLNYEFKINISGIDNSKAEKIDEVNTALSKHYGFTQNIVGMEFESITNGVKKIHVIVGFKKANRKYPILTNELTTNSGYKFEVASVKKKLGGDKLINRFANLDKLI